MKRGFDAPIRGPDTTPSRLGRMVRHGEIFPSGRQPEYADGEPAQIAEDIFHLEDLGLGYMMFGRSIVQ